MMNFRFPRYATVSITTLLLIAGAVTVSAGGHGAKKSKGKDIVDTAVAAGSFETLVAAVQAADLVDTLKGDGPFTVFAPTDEAFAKLPKGTVESLLADKEKLAAILTYHVVSGNLSARQVVAKSSLDTVQGSALAVDASDGVMVGNARIVQADIETSNGVIHIIDTVLIPSP